MRHPFLLSPTHLNRTSDFHLLPPTLQLTAWTPSAAATACACAGSACALRAGQEWIAMTRCQPVRSSVQDTAPISLSQTPAPASPTGRGQTATQVRPADYCSARGKLQVHIASFLVFLQHAWVCQVPFSGDLVDTRQKYGLKCLSKTGLCAHECICAPFMLVVNEISTHDSLTAVPPPTHTPTHTMLCIHIHTVYSCAISLR